jgi:hypothetical protein
VSAESGQHPVNASGFLFQLRLEQEITSGYNKVHPWSVAATEHPWHHEKAERSGFADIVIADGGITRLVIECKRVRNASWYFLLPKDAKPTSQRSSLFWVHDVPRKGQRLGWDNIRHFPPSLETAYCVIRGSGENDEPLLERLGAKLVDSVEAIARDEVLHVRQTGVLDTVVYVPVIVTNAQLFAVMCDVPAVNIETGTLADIDQQPIDYIRFRKALSSRLPWPTEVRTIPQISEARQRTVFVVRSTALTEFLRAFVQKHDHVSLPWLLAEARNAPVSDTVWL